MQCNHKVGLETANSSDGDNHKDEFLNPNDYSVHSGFDPEDGTYKKSQTVSWAAN